MQWTSVYAESLQIRISTSNLLPGRAWYPLCCQLYRLTRYQYFLFPEIETRKQSIRFICDVSVEHSPCWKL